MHKPIALVNLLSLLCSGCAVVTVADAAVSPGGCLIESSATTVDATIEKRWARAVGNLGQQAAWNPQDTDV